MYKRQGKKLGSINGRNYDNQDILKYVDVGATYYFNKNMSTHADYKINLLKDNQFTRDAGINTCLLYTSLHCLRRTFCIVLVYIQPASLAILVNTRYCTDHLDVYKRQELYITKM